MGFSGQQGKRRTIPLFTSQFSVFRTLRRIKQKTNLFFDEQIAENLDQLFQNKIFICPI